MKELCIDIMNANDGELPPGLTSGDVLKMYKLKIYNWDELLSPFYIFIIVI